MLAPTMRWGYFLISKLCFSSVCFIIKICMFIGYSEAYQHIRVVAAAFLVAVTFLLSFYAALQPQTL